MQQYACIKKQAWSSRVWILQHIVSQGLDETSREGTMEPPTNKGTVGNGIYIF